MMGFSGSVNLLSVIALLAKSDLTRALNAARSLTVPEPRALSVIAASRAALATDKKPFEMKKQPSPLKIQGAEKRNE